MYHVLHFSSLNFILLLLNIKFKNFTAEKDRVAVDSAYLVGGSFCIILVS